MDFDVVYSHSARPEKLNLNINEVMRYMGQGREDEKVNELISSLMPISIEKAMPKASFVLKRVMEDEKGIMIGNVLVSSMSLKKYLLGCDRAIVFAMTLGAETDRLIFSRVNESAACHTLSSIATALMEEYADALCDELNKFLKLQGLELKQRFGVGYGDFSLTHQKDVLNMCEGYKRCGITTTNSLMLVPTKSIPGIMGIKGE